MATSLLQWTTTSYINTTTGSCLAKSATAQAASYSMAKHIKESTVSSNGIIRVQTLVHTQSKLLGQYFYVLWQRHPFDHTMFSVQSLLMVLPQPQQHLQQSFLLRTKACVEWSAHVGLSGIKPKPLAKPPNVKNTVQIEEMCEFLHQFEHNSSNRKYYVGFWWNREGWWHH